MAKKADDEATEFSTEAQSPEAAKSVMDSIQAERAQQPRRGGMPADPEFVTPRRRQ